MRDMTMAERSHASQPVSSTGSLVMVTGSMFSGKTEEWIQRFRRALYARRRVQVFKRALETLSELEEIPSHDDYPHEAVAISSSEELLGRVEEGTDLVAVEEAQFFDTRNHRPQRDARRRRVRGDLRGPRHGLRGEPFGPVPALLAVADEVVKLRAICAVCGRGASRLQWLIDGEPASASVPTILVGAPEVYEARCRHHHEVPR